MHSRGTNHREGECRMKAEEYKKAENLRSTRVPMEYTATYTMGNISGEGFITDISERGVAIRVKQALAIGDILHITSKISNELILEFTGEVRNINGNIAGIMIKLIDPGIQERFMNHIDSMLRLMHMKGTEQYKLDKNRIKKR